MHKSSKQALETIAHWNKQILASDEFILRLEAGLPDVPDDTPDSVPYIDLGSSLGDVSLTLYKADAATDMVPYLTAVRKAGYTRVGTPTTASDNSSIIWNYTAKVDDVQISLTARLNFKTTNAVCQNVQIGVMTVPKMKMMCAEELATWLAEHPED